jgi:putative ABC transport system substrate-binding protein
MCGTSAVLASIAAGELTTRSGPRQHSPIAARQLSKRLERDSFDTLFPSTDEGARVKRREFIAVVGGAAAWSLAARAQQPQRRIGVLMQYAESDPEGEIRIDALGQALQKLGWIAGGNLHIDYRWAGGDRDQFQGYAADLVKLGEEVIVAVSTPAVKALQRETRVIPIIFTQVSDPVGQGIIQSMARPDGNVTGFANYDPAIGGKWLELLKEAAPSVTRAAIVFNPQTAPYTGLYVRAMEAVAPSIRTKVISAPVHNESEIEAFFAKHAREPGGGLIVMTDAFNSAHRKQIIEFSARFALPAVYPYRYYVADGGLMTYAVEQVEQFRGTAVYIDRILKGEKVGALPVQAPDRYRLIINLKAAKALGLTIPPAVLARADEVIE